MKTAVTKRSVRVAIFYENNVLYRTLVEGDPRSLFSTKARGLPRSIMLCKEKRKE